MIEAEFGHELFENANTTAAILICAEAFIVGPTLRFNAASNREIC